MNCSMHEMYQTSNARISDGKTPSTMVEVETSFPMEKGYSIHDHLRMSENTPELVIKNDEEEEEKVEKYGSSKDRRRKTRRTSTLSNETKKSSVNNNLVESNGSVHGLNLDVFTKLLVTKIFLYLEGNFLQNLFHYLHLSYALASI